MEAVAWTIDRTCATMTRHAPKKPRTFPYKPRTQEETAHRAKKPLQTTISPSCDAANEMAIPSTARPPPSLESRHPPEQYKRSFECRDKRHARHNENARRGGPCFAGDQESVTDRAKEPAEHGDRPTRSEQGFEPPSKRDHHGESDDQLDGIAQMEKSNRRSIHRRYRWNHR